MNATSRISQACTTTNCQGGREMLLPGSFITLHPQTGAYGVRRGWLRHVGHHTYSLTAQGYREIPTSQA